MSIGHCYLPDVGAAPYVAVPAADSQPLHRLATVRRQQGVSRHAVARRLNIDVEQVRQQESEDSDLPLSTLYAWQSILDVPVAELLVEPSDGLPSSLLLRSQLLRLMKTVRAISEKAKQESVRRMAETMAGQLVEIMPEVADVGAWNIGGRERRRSELGVAAQRRMADELFVESDDGESVRRYLSFAGEEAYAGDAALGPA
jgi:transcriptional regulator with XRE-family HTH domain